MTVPTRPSNTELYDKLPLRDAKDIRLVSIKSHDKVTGDIHCDLCIVSLVNNPKYTALSYTWGPATHTGAAAGGGSSSSSYPSPPMYSILCNNTSVLVTENLYTFLLQVSKNSSTLSTPATAYFWIDALCINLENLDERGSQVRMMADIYHSAECVNIWLGDADQKSTEMGFKIIKELAKYCTSNHRYERVNALQSITPASLGTEELSRQLGACAEVSYWNSMVSVFQRRYFTRSWIIQEVILAKTAVVLCGSHSVTWGDIVVVSEFLTVTSWTRWICPNVSGKQPSNHGVPAILDAIKTLRCSKDNSNVMLYTLIRSRRFLATDPRDKIYSLLGVAGDYAIGKIRFKPIYGNQSVVKTYTDAAIQILQDSKDLLLLAHVEGDHCQTIAGLPSWVPDWSYNEVLGLGVTGYERYSAAGSLPRTLLINEPALTLQLEGVRIDRVAAIGETKLEVLNGNKFPKWLSIFATLSPIYHHHTGQSQTRSQVFWRTLICDTAGTPPVYPASDYHQQSYVLWMKSKLASHLELQKDAMEIDLLSEIGGGDIGGQIIPGRTARTRDNHQQQKQEQQSHSNGYETTFSHAPRLRLFVTESQYLGMSSESVLEGDSVWVIKGSRVPLILRETRAGVYRIVGGAYVHGIMRGEALKADCRFCDITIE